MDKCYFGIDTSNYTTSVCIFNASKNEFISKRKLLSVDKGKLGLRQSDAVFQHIKNMPVLVEDAMFENLGEIMAYGASDRPRDRDKSYMPCFKVGSGLANTLGEIENKRYYFFTHQQGHIAAALFSTGKLDLMTKEFIAFHVSGGTTDAVLCKSERELLKCEELATSKDLHAGQLIDRAGLMLGLDFPCGKGLERLALRCSDDIKVKPTIRNGDCCLSGYENQAQKLADKKKSKGYIAKFILSAVSVSLCAMLDLILKEHKLPVVFSGGVMSNSLIRSYITDNIDAEMYFCDPEYSTDNAMGIALLTAIKDLRDGKVQDFNSITG